MSAVFTEPPRAAVLINKGFRMSVMCKIFILFALFGSGYSLNILGVFLYPGKSHFFVYEPYLKELARRGHNVTIISYFPQKKNVNNINDIKLSDNFNVAEESIPLQNGYMTLANIILYIMEAARESCTSLLQNQKVQDLYNNGVKFDVVVTELFNNDCPLGLAHKLGAPVVGLTSTVLMPWHFDRFSIRDISTIFPLLSGGHRPNLYQRVERIISHVAIHFSFKYFVYRAEEEILSEYLDDLPSLEELRSNMKFLLLYQNLLLGSASPLPPYLIDVGGYHVAEPRELPHDIKKFIEESDNGVIYISFGSMLNASTAPIDKVEAIIGAISELPQRVIWKWEEKSLPDNLKNILVSSWLPQNDILAHPKVLAFFSHCGLLGTTEAIHHGVPMVGMPIFGDQPANAASMEESGLGVQIQIEELTKENLLEKFKTVLDPSFRNRVKHLSEAWRDRPLSAMDTAIYWTEFAAKYRNFTFRSPSADVPMYQYLYIDVILVLGSTLALIFVVIRSIIKSILSLTRMVCKDKKKLKGN